MDLWHRGKCDWTRPISIWAGSHGRTLRFTTRMTQLITLGYWRELDMPWLRLCVVSAYLCLWLDNWNRTNRALFGVLTASWDEEFDFHQTAAASIFPTFPRIPKGTNIRQRGLVVVNKWTNKCTNGENFTTELMEKTHCEETYILYCDPRNRNGLLLIPHDKFVGSAFCCGQILNFESSAKPNKRLHNGCGVVMTPLTQSGECFWIMVLDVLNQQSADYHLVWCHTKRTSSTTCQALPPNQDNDAKGRKSCHSQTSQQITVRSSSSENSKSGAEGSQMVICFLTSHVIGQSECLEDYLTPVHSPLSYSSKKWGDASPIHFWFGVGLLMSGETKDRWTHWLTSTWNTCGFLTNRLPLPRSARRPLGGIQSIPWLSLLLAVWMRLWVKGVALCDWWAMAN